MKSCFIMMPISTPADVSTRSGGDKDHFRRVLDHIFFPAIIRCGFQPIAPAASGSSIIHAEIVKNVLQSDLALCDMSGLNPNVFFELGLRTACNKPVILVRDEHTTIPFDKQVVNVHMYDSSLRVGGSVEQEIEKLSRHINSVCEVDIQSNSFWKQFTSNINLEEWPFTTSKPKFSIYKQTLGHWWEYITRQDGATALSFMQITDDPGLQSVHIKGTSYLPDASVRGWFKSVGSCVNSVTNEVFYYWQGEEKGPPNDHFGGFGVFSFSPTSKGDFVSGTGHFWRSQLLDSDANTNSKQRVELERATVKEIDVMASSKRSTIKNLLMKKFARFVS